MRLCIRSTHNGHYSAAGDAGTLLKIAGPGIMRTFKSIADGIDRINAVVGRVASWCCLFVVAAEFAVVVMRYAFGVGSIALQELVVYAAAAVYMLAAGWTLKTGGHVRVDVFYASAGPRKQALVDLLGALVFLIPFAVTLTLISLPYVERSWAILEHSRESSGLPFAFLIKGLIPLFAVLIGLQGVAQAIRAALALFAPTTLSPR
jgi:TRAP-type mannitol/chloroaromatic compound transport system permease small subunit